MDRPVNGGAPLELAAPVALLARRAAEAILAIYAAPVTAVLKADQSPLTEADLVAHRLIVKGLAALTPALPVLSEESEPVSAAVRQRWPAYWLVDPLDGTREFVSRNGEFTVNIALIDRGRPVLGVVQVPVQDRCYVGVPGSGAWCADGDAPRRPIRVAGTPADPPRVLGSRSHRGSSLDSFLDALGPHELISAGSSLKFCRLAEGAAEVYPRLGPTSEWDTAAGQAVVEAAGGHVVELSGAALAYNQRAELLNPHFLACAGDPAHWLALLPTS